MAEAKPYAHTEAQLETLFRLRVQSIGGRVVKMAPTVRGVPDRLVLLPDGRLRLVELKTTTGKLSPIQRHWHQMASALGHRVDTLYGLDQIDEWCHERATEYDIL